MTQDPNKLQLIECVVDLSLRAHDLNLPEFAMLLEKVAYASLNDEEDELRVYAEAFAMHKLICESKKFAKDGIVPPQKPDNETQEQ